MIYIKKQTYCLTNNVWTYANKKLLLKPLSLLCYNFFFSLFKSLETYIIGWSLFHVTFWNNITPTTNKDAYVWTWNSTSQFSDININASIYFYLINSKAFWHSSFQRKVFVFLVSLMIVTIIATFVKLCHPIEYLNLLGIFRWWHVFFGSSDFPSLETIKSKIILKKYHKCTFVWI